MQPGGPQPSRLLLTMTHAVCDLELLLRSYHVPPFISGTAGCAPQPHPLIYVTCCSLLQAVNPSLNPEARAQAASAALYYTQLAAAGGFTAPSQQEQVGAVQCMLKEKNKTGRTGSTRLAVCMLACFPRDLEAAKNGDW
eukprot:1136526-Pelagomonas_calceolata.AAC.2